ncbi:uncharacterized protein LOC143349811 isoform X1 [Colletes latitarsis]|uniref:uncharacterized protein LOC143349811 isoform X1 n=1 Tax=Colletes latitarsis TaxID=2605962 RepID=UPI0040351F2D
MAVDCKRSKTCFNCQGFNHIAAVCRERKRNAPSMRRRPGENPQSGYRGRNERQHRGRGETMLKTYEEVVIRVSEISKKKNKLYVVSEIDKNDTCESNNCRVWLLDSGSTSHMTHDELICNNFVQEERRISMADKDGKVLTSKGIGNVVVRQASSNNNIVKLQNVLCVPEQNSNLLSVAKIIDHGYDVNFNKYGAIVYNKSDGIQMTAIRVQDVYYVRTSIHDEKTATVSTNNEI